MLLFKPVSSSAFTVNSINDVGGVLKAGPVYDSATDQIRIDFYGSSVVQTVHRFNQPDGTVRVSDAPSGSWWVATGFTCVGNYQFEAKGSSGQTLLTMNLTVDEGDLINPKCDSGSAGESPSKEAECAALICECIAELEKPLNSIDAAVKDSNAKLDQVNGNLGDLKVIGEGIKKGVSDLHDEFKTDKNYALNPVKSTKDLLDKNKPSQPTTPFKDDSVRFSDPGSAAPVGKLPKAPEPKDWDGFLPDLAMPPEKEKSKDVEKSREPENQKDTQFDLDQFELDAPLSKDTFTKTPEMTKDGINQSPELSKDVMSQDGEMVKDTSKQSPILEVDPFESTDKFQKNHEYQQTNKFP